MSFRSVVAAGAAFVLSVLLAPAASAITGGHESPHAYPFLGSLQRPESPRSDGHACGATLIAPKWMVTAGHCVRNEQESLTGHPKDWRVRIGSLGVSSGGEVIEVEKFVRHPGPLHGNDIALLKLAKPSTRTPIEIADDSPAPGTPTRIMGWGMTCQQETSKCFPDRLREADTVVQARSECAADGIKGTEICVGSLDGTVGPTNMDSGGPALVRSGDDWRLVGAVSGGRGPYVYSDVTAFRPWLRETMARRTPSPEDAGVVVPEPV